MMNVSKFKEKNVSWVLIQVQLPGELKKVREEKPEQAAFVPNVRVGPRQQIQFHILSMISLSKAMSEALREYAPCS